MQRWQLMATLVAILFGAHNLFIKRAAGRLPDSWGALILEGSAALALLLGVALAATWERFPSWPTDRTAVAFVVTGGLCIAAGSILYFRVFRMGAPLAQAVPWVLTGWVVVVVLWGLLFEGEALKWRHAAGLCSAAAALWLLR